MWAAEAANAPQYETLYFQQPCDHTNFAVDAPTFQQRYLSNASFLSSDGGGVLMYVGNEADVEDFAASAGYVWTLAEELGAAVVFAEHRGYGESATATATTTDPTAGSACGDGFAHISATAALADFASLGRYLQSKHGRRVVALGGSYGGMLAAWARARYPSTFAGAVASSAPVALDSQCPANDTYARLSANYPCASEVGEAFRSLRAAAQKDPAGLAETLSLCAPLDDDDQGGDTTTTTTTTTDALIGTFQQAFMTMAQANFPYAVDPLPANPAAAACEAFAEAAPSPQVEQLAAAVAVVPSLDPARSPGGCLNVTATTFEETLPGMLPGAWGFQRCSDMLIRFEASEESAPIFLPCSEYAPNCWGGGERFAHFCRGAYGVDPLLRGGEAGVTAFGGRDLGALSEVVFTNGALDPWGAGGVGPRDAAAARAGSGVVALPDEPGAAHHLDLRAPNAADPPGVVAARELIAEHTARWLRGGHVQ
jgi:lysosomal Pro-X carboxypeptidase